MGATRTSPSAPPAAPDSRTGGRFIQRRAAVVGAGISGLAVGYELGGRGVECDVFEAASTAGGVIRSTRTSAGLLEWGPQRLRLVPALRAIVDDLGLAGRLVLADSDAPLYIVRDGRLHRVPRSVRELTTASLLSPLARLRVLAEPVTAAVGPAETVAGALTRKFGGEAYRTLLGPLFGGLYASDPAEMIARDSLHRFLEAAGAPRSVLLHGLRLGAGSSPACSFRDGLAELPAALARSLGGSLHLRHPVESVSPATGGGWSLGVAGTSRGPYSALVLALPSDEAARLLASVARPAAERLARLHYNQLAVVHLQAGGAPIPGFGYQVAFGESLETRGVTFNDWLFGRDGIVTAFLGGAANDRLPRWPENRIAAVAEREFRQVTGRAAATLEVSRPRVPAYDTSWSALQGLALPDGIHLCASYLERPGIGGRFAQAARVAARVAGRETGT